ncbi:MAG: peptidoglycan-binding protein, partial [Kofleriaceae bacterium]
GPQAFASTTQFADELARLLGVPSEQGPVLQPAPLCRIEARNERPRDHDEHVNALTGWGPAFAVQALAALAGSGAATPTSPPAPGTASGAPPNRAVILRRGDRGAEVRRWQEELAALGFELGSADGIFGARTEEATRALQRAAGIAPDGVVGPATRTAAAAFQPTGGRPQPAQPPIISRTLVEQFVAVAREELKRGARERPLGSNAGEDVERYLEGEIAPPAQWCGAFLRWCLRQAAARTGEKPVVEGSLGAKTWMAQFQKIGRWASGRSLRTGAHALRPGMVAILHRGPPGAWTGHVALVISMDAFSGTFTTIEGNSGVAGDRVASMTKDIADPTILGVGWLD